MQKTDLAMQEAIFDAIYYSFNNWKTCNEETYVKDFLEELTSHGYKVVKDTE